MWLIDTLKLPDVVNAAQCSVWLWGASLNTKWNASFVLNIDLIAAIAMALTAFCQICGGSELGGALVLWQM